MRATRLLALIAVGTTAAAALAQENFPDVPANHWAYEALARMKKDGLLVGYPDTLFRGGRPASRYEMAVAIHAAFTNLKLITDRTDVRLKAISDRLDKAASKDDIDALRSEISALQADVATIKSFGNDIANLRRASDTFEKELTQIGVDVQAMRDQLKDLDGRVGRLETRPYIAISGDVNFWLGGGHTLDDKYGLSKDGRLTGVSDKGAAGSVFPPVPNRTGITDDAAWLTEAAINLNSTNETGLRWKVTGVYTSMFGQDPFGGVPSTGIGFGNQSDVFNPTNGNAGSPALFGYGEGSGDAYLQEVALNYDWRGIGFEFGRIRLKGSPWLFQRIDNTTYFANERWDDGKYTLDGLSFNGAIGSAAYQVFGGRSSSVNSVNGVQVNPLRSGAAEGVFGTDGGNRLQADRAYGATVTGRLFNTELRGDYVGLDSDTVVNGSYGDFDRLDAYGTELAHAYRAFRLSGGIRQTSLYNNSSRLHGLTDTAWNGDLGWKSGSLDLKVGYREIGLNYLAPGDWGRLGVLRNPTNVRGWTGSAALSFGAWNLSADGELSAGLRNTDAAGSFFDRDTKIERFNVRLARRINASSSVYVSYEQTDFRNLSGDAVDGTPRYRWYGIGYAQTLSGNAKFTLAYEQSDVRNDYQTSGGFVGNQFRGGLLTSQLTFRF